MKKLYEQPCLQMQAATIADVIMSSGFGEDEYYTDDPYENVGITV